MRIECVAWGRIGRLGRKDPSDAVDQASAAKPIRRPPSHRRLGPTQPYGSYHHAA
jgi:hypothetical protein